MDVVSGNGKDQIFIEDVTARIRQEEYQRGKVTVVISAAISCVQAQRALQPAFTSFDPRGLMRKQEALLHVLFCGNRMCREVFYKLG